MTTTQDAAHCATNARAVEMRIQKLLTDFEGRCGHVIKSVTIDTTDHAEFGTKINFFPREERP